MVQAWLTRSQVVKLYESEEVADAIIAGKNVVEIRPHPEAPLCQAATQYSCMASAEKVKELKNVDEQGLALQFNVDKDHAQAMYDNISAATDEIEPLQGPPKNHKGGGKGGPPALTKEQKEKKAPRSVKTDSKQRAAGRIQQAAAIKQQAAGSRQQAASSI